MSLTQLLGVLRASRWSILLMTLVSATVAFLFAQTLPQQYTAKARVLLDVGSTDPALFSSVRRDSVDSYISTAIRLVGDINVSEAVVDQLGWTQNPAVIDAWQQQTQGKVELRAWAASRIVGNLGAAQLQDSAVIEIFYSAGDPGAAKQIVGMIRNAYIDNSQRLRVEGASRAAKWNRQQAARAKADLEKAEQERLAFAKANNLTLSPDGVTSEMQTLDASIQEVTKRVERRAVVPPPQGPSPMMLSLQMQLNAAQAATAAFADRGPSNPDYLMALTRQQSLEAQLAKATQDAQRDNGGILQETQEMRARADQDYVNARLAVLQQSDTYDHLADLERAIARKKRLYDAAVMRASQFDLQAAAPSTIKIVGDVIGSDDPSFPNVPLATGLAAGFGLMLGIALTLITEMLGHRVRTSEDLAASASVPVLAVIEPGTTRRRMGRRWRWPRLRRGTLQPAE